MLKVATILCLSITGKLSCSALNKYLVHIAAIQYFSEPPKKQRSLAQQVQKVTFMVYNMWISIHVGGCCN